SDEDEDFGATPNLFADRAGTTVVGAGRKDGTYYVVDAADGRLMRRSHVAEALPGVGGFIGSSAVWEGQVFGATALGSLPAYHAIDAATGALRWQGLAAPGYGASAVVNGVVFAGSLDGLLQAFDAATGLLLWASPLLGPISSGPVVAGDMVFIGSGTSTSDLCAKGIPGSELCLFVFDNVLGQLGAVHGFVLCSLEAPSSPRSQSSGAHALAGLC
ncbi:MAG: PQQ-binding-like beta-propeller repeat protein, partial [Acidimicrobiales bacterium]